MPEEAPKSQPREAPQTASSPAAAPAKQRVLRPVREGYEIHGSDMIFVVAAAVVLTAALPLTVFTVTALPGRLLCRSPAWALPIDQAIASRLQDGVCYALPAYWSQAMAPVTELLRGSKWGTLFLRSAQTGLAVTTNIAATAEACWLNHSVAAVPLIIFIGLVITPLAAMSFWSLLVHPSWRTRMTALAFAKASLAVLVISEATAALGRRSKFPSYAAWPRAGVVGQVSFGPVTFMAHRVSSIWGAASPLALLTEAWSLVVLLVLVVTLLLLIKRTRGRPDAFLRSTIHREQLEYYGTGLSIGKAIVVAVLYIGWCILLLASFAVLTERFRTADPFLGRYMPSPLSLWQTVVGDFGQVSNFLDKD